MAAKAKKSAMPAKVAAKKKSPLSVKETRSLLGASKVIPVSNTADGLNRFRKRHEAAQEKALRDSARMPKPKGPPLVEMPTTKSKPQPPAPVAPEDHPEGKGLVAAIRNSRDIPDDLPDEDENTAADQRRRAAAAKNKAQAAVLELPNTPETELLLKSTKLPPDVRVMRYHDSMQWSSCLMWLTRSVTEQDQPVLVKGKMKTVKKPVEAIDAIHVIHRGAMGGLTYSKMNPTNSMYFAEIQGGYPVGHAVRHFKHHADTLGATKQVRELLGLKGEPPIQYKEVEQVNEETGERELVRVEKKPKGGNSNKPQPNAELDELYDRAARLLGVKEQDLRGKYAHLNNGLQAMNLRNRLRNKGHNT